DTGTVLPAHRQDVGSGGVALAHDSVRSFSSTHPSPSTHRRTIRAGTPATTQRSGTSPRTTAPAATTTCSPICVPGRITALAPSQLPEPMRTAASVGHWRPIGSTGSRYVWFWWVMETYGPVWMS